MKRIAMLMIFFLLCCTALVGCNFSVSSAKIEDAQMTTAVDDQGKPIDEVTTYASDAVEIVVSTMIRNAPDNTEVRFVLYNSDQIVLTEVKSDSGDLSDRYLYCVFSPKVQLAEGIYKVEIYVDERKEPDATVKFSITAAKKNSVSISDAQMTSGISEGKPVDSVSTYEPTAKFIAAAVLHDTEKDTKVRFVWNYLTEDKQFLEYPLDPQGKSEIYISCEFTPDQPMPEGEYRVDIYVDDQKEPNDSIQFTVQASQASNSDTVNLDLSTYTSERLGFSIGYPVGWEKVELDNDDAVVFFSKDYIIQDQEGLNTVICMSFKNAGELPSLENYLNAQVTDTEAMNLKDYAPAIAKIKDVNGRDMALHAYSYTADGMSVTSMSFILFDENDLYQINFMGPDRDIEALGPIVTHMAESFVIN